MHLTEIVCTGLFSWTSPYLLPSSIKFCKFKNEGQTGTMIIIWPFWHLKKYVKKINKAIQYSKPLDSVKLETLGHIPSSFTSFKKDAASMHCSTVRPRPSQMSRYSCNFGSWHSPLPQMTQSTVLPCHQNWPLNLNGTHTSSDFSDWIVSIRKYTSIPTHTAYKASEVATDFWWWKTPVSNKARVECLQAFLFLLLMFYVSLSFCLSSFLSVFLSQRKRSSHVRPRSFGLTPNS